MTEQSPYSPEGVVEETLHAFEGLAHLSPDEPLIVEEGHRTVVRYVVEPLFVDVELDWQERIAFLLVGRTRDGEVPDGYYKDSSGDMVRFHLGSALAIGNREAKDLSRRLYKQQGASGAPAMKTQVRVFADAVLQYRLELPGLIDRLDAP